MKARYDDNMIPVTPRFERALIELMVAQCEMMRQAEPKSADCWTWGRCTIEDLSSAHGLAFEFGGEEDKPEGGDFAVAVPVLTIERSKPRKRR